MGKPFEMEWDHYLQAFRLHQRATKEANREAGRVLREGIGVAKERKRDLPRAHGLLSFVSITAWLNDWVDPRDAREMLAGANKEIADLRGRKEIKEQPLASAMEDLKTLTARQPLNRIVTTVATFRAALAVSLDPEDFDNRWSLATAYLYGRKFDEAFAEYDEAARLAKERNAPEIGRASLKIDFADALFFAGLPGAAPDRTGPDGIRRAIEVAQEAIREARARAPDDPKRFRWNWTLGWAYYEAECYARSLALLSQIRNPHDLIRKNIIANYGALGRIEAAVPIAREFLDRNPAYTLAVEDRWPYRDPERLERWKGHLRAAGLPD